MTGYDDSHLREKTDDLQREVDMLRGVVAGLMVGRRVRVRGHWTGYPRYDRVPGAEGECSAAHGDHVTVLSGGDEVRSAIDHVEVIG